MFIDPDGKRPNRPMNEEGRKVLVNTVKRAVSLAGNLFNSGVKAVDRATSPEVTTLIGNAASIVEAGAMAAKKHGLRNAAAIIGDVTAAFAISKDLATTDFNDNNETADFVENTTQTVIETAAGPLGAAVNVILEDSKKDDGVTNTRRMSNDFKGSYRTSNAYVYRNFTLRRQQEAEARRQQQEERNENEQ
jgi:hypothetical protein